MPTEMKPTANLYCDRSLDPARQVAEIIAALKAGADLEESDKNGVTPLHHAVRFRSPAVVKVLLEHGADVNRQCKRSGSTALHRAVTSTGAPGTANKAEEARQIIEILLEFGADPAIKNKMGKRPVDYVRDEGLRAILRPVKKRRKPS